MFEDDDFMVFRGPCTYESHTMVCLAMKLNIETTAETVFHVVTERCRCVLFTFPGKVLVAPQSDHFLMICDPNFTSTDSFKSVAAKISVVEAWSSPVNSQVMNYIIVREGYHSPLF